MKTSAAGEPLVAVGRFGRPHAVRGEIRLDPMGGLPRGLSGYRRFFVDAKPHPKPLEIVGWRENGKWLILTLAGVADRDAVAAYTGKTLWVAREELPPLGPDEYYHCDIPGAAVVDEAGAELGVVEDVKNWGEYDMLVIRTGAKRWMLPVIEAFVVAMDVQGRRITARVPEGLGP